MEGDRGIVSTQEWLQLFIENEPSCEAQIREVFAGFGGTIRPLSYTEAWIRYFRDQGYKIYYLSNFSYELHRQAYEKLKFLDTFDGGIFSWKEKCIKPDEQIYRLLLKRYSIDPAAVSYTHLDVYKRQTSSCGLSMCTRCRNGSVHWKNI